MSSNNNLQRGLYKKKRKEEKKQKRKLLKKRTYSFLIDLFLIGIINKTIILTYANFMTKNLFYLSFHKQMKLLENLDQLHFPILLCVFIGYFIISLYLSNGQTLGKIIFHLKVLDEGGAEHLTLKACILRTLGYAVGTFSGFFLLGLPYFTKNEKGLPDWPSKSFVSSQNGPHTTIPTNGPETLQLDLFYHVNPTTSQIFLLQKKNAEKEITKERTFYKKAS